MENNLFTVKTAIVAGFIISFFGGSSVQIAGPTAAFATIVAGIVATQGMDGLFIATILAGIMLILMGVFKLGSLINLSPNDIKLTATTLLFRIHLIAKACCAQGTTLVEECRRLNLCRHVVARASTAQILSRRSSLTLGVTTLNHKVLYHSVEQGSVEKAL